MNIGLPGPGPMLVCSTFTQPQIANDEPKSLFQGIKGCGVIVIARQDMTMQLVGFHCLGTGSSSISVGQAQSPVHDTKKSHPLSALNA